MSAQTQARTSGNGDQVYAGAGKGPSAPSREAISAERSDLWTAQAKLWSGNAFGRSAAAMMIPSIDACLSWIHDWRDFSRAEAEQFEEDAKILRDGWQELGQCEAPEDYAKAGTALHETLTKQCAKSTQKIAALSGEYATRRVQAMSTLAASVMEQARVMTKP